MIKADHVLQNFHILEQSYVFRVRALRKRNSFLIFFGFRFVFPFSKPSIGKTEWKEESFSGE